MPRALNSTHSRPIPWYVTSDWSSDYIHRKMLRVQEAGDGPQLSIMTYNVLALCGKRRYRHGNGTHMIQYRYPILTHEIGTYNADIICLQEIDQRKTSKLRKRLSSLGYCVVFQRIYSPNALAICYKKDLFEERRCGNDHALEPEVNELRNSSGMYGRFMMLCLTFKTKFLREFEDPSRDGVVIVNTHLPSRIESVIQRLKQTAALLMSVEDFSKSCGWESSNEFYTFVVGDFNSGANSLAYQSLVTRPLEFSSERKAESDEFKEIEDLHNSIESRAISLYSAGNSPLDAANSDTDKSCDNESHEPSFSFWGPKWQGLLDYIFVLGKSHDLDNTEVDIFDDLNKAGKVRLLALLRMPEESEMDEPMPRVGEYPSDHLCMMADVELL